MPPTILVADDEMDLREILMDVLRDAGFDVRSSPDGHAALELHTAVPADVILSDMMMPNLDGLGLVQALRERGDHTPFVLMSAAPRPPLPDGISWVAKPFDVETVIATVRGAAGASRG